MSTARVALYRNAQEFFRSHLLDLYRWEAVEHSRPQVVDRPEGINERRERGWYRGQVHDKIEMRFGPFELTVTGPFEDEKHPRGLITARAGQDTCEGPIDPATWDRVAAFIRENQHEEAYGSAAGSDWGR